jgi:Flp pilus assembly protein TadB
VPVARCSSCNRLICDTCYRFRLDGDPACVRCAYEASTRPRRRVSLAISFLAFSFAAFFWLARRYELVAREPFLLGMGAVVAAIVALFIGLSGKQTTASLEHRDVDEAPTSRPLEAYEDVGSPTPYRTQARVRRVLLAASPRVSGSATALVVVLCLAASAVLVPASLRLPRWIEEELVLGIWWLVVAGTLATLLHRGFRLRDDYVYFAPWDRPTRKDGKDNAEKPGPLGTPSGCGDLSGMDGEGFVFVLALVVVLGAALGAAWVFVELVMPVLFLVMYWLFMRAIAQVARDHRECKGELGRSLGWASFWASVYVAPVAALVWIFHMVHR